ncbi:hypothetical protein [uncultured Eudoraea sp.]|uniref:hypothetical protein n=1 Tax=uncultured Eudoraea sp. TaxID=1035614 RepID=UPI0026389577|nr:hypothetical protein [uncultured Eudoraea sp.]
MKILIRLLLITIIWVSFSCSKDSSDPDIINTPEPGPVNSTSDLVAVDFVVDFGNNENASDLVVRYSVNNTSNLSAVWLFITPESIFSSINSTTLSELPSERYESIDIKTSFSEISPSEVLLDTQGNQIRQGIKYKLGFATVKGDKISKDLVNITFELRDQHYLTGRYTGIWNDDTYSNFMISVEITSDGSSLGGTGYNNHQFVAQYGGDDDFVISAQIEGDQLKSIVWDEFLDDFMGGCEGLGTGTGTLEDLVTISMTLEFENCLYSTSNAEIEFSRTN